MRRRDIRIVLAVAVAVLVIAAAALIGLALGSRSTNASPSAPSPGPYRGSEPPAGIEAPEFALPDQAGRLVRMSSLRGQVVLVTFLDTACKEKCPIIAGQIAGGLRLLSRAERAQVEPLAITVNPLIDTPAHVARFLREHHLTGQLRYLTASVSKLMPVWRAFHVLPAVETGDNDLHSADVRVFDRRGVWVSTLHTPVDLTPANLAHDIRTALG